MLLQTAGQLCLQLSTIINAKPVASPEICGPGLFTDIWNLYLESLGVQWRTDLVDLKHSTTLGSSLVIPAIEKVKKKKTGIY